MGVVTLSIVQRVVEQHMAVAAVREAYTHLCIEV
jgi:hypothetical protein